MSEVSLRTGGCLCGAVRYEVSAEPIFTNDCQCHDCQRTSGTGHGSYLTFPSRGHVKVAGEAARWDMVGDSGKVLFAIEHEVRSMRHPLYARPQVNRNPDQTNRSFAPGYEELSWSLPANG